MIFFRPEIALHPLYPAIDNAYLNDEDEVVAELLPAAKLTAETSDRISERARALVVEVRKQRLQAGGIDAFMHQYELSSQEGIVLMCLAEALLRIPDSETVDKLIKDKMGAADWQSHLGNSDSLFVNASTWGLMLGGRLVKLDDGGNVLKRLLQRSGEPVVRQAMLQAMRILGRQFVLGRTIDEALSRAASVEKQGYRHSYDMLGEGARTARDAQRYLEAYHAAIEAIGASNEADNPIAAPGISVKLSALHPRYQLAHGERLTAELLPKLRELALAAKAHNIGFTVDAEEADRFDLSLALIAAVFADPALAGWQGFGLALQAYQKRAFHSIDLLTDLARQHGRRLMVRLVKGAYWDTEIKRAQERGLVDYPVFTRKANTDVSYLACAAKLLQAGDAVYPQFATHNARTVAAILELAGNRTELEFQRLHGMGEALYRQVVGADKLDRPCRIYAPVGSHEDLLAYLVRRLLENGANTSFVNRIVDEKAPIDEIIADPVGKVAKQSRVRHPRIPLPRHLFGEARLNSAGIDLTNLSELGVLEAGVDQALRDDWRAAPLVGGIERSGGAERKVYSPAESTRMIGTVVDANDDDVDKAVARAQRAAEGWSVTPASDRATCLERCADLLEREIGQLVGLCALEGGKTIADGVAEVREAVDFCRYYAARARADFDQPLVLPGPTGEHDELSLHGRGVFVCISPWNFPLAIFLGQVGAALVAGNTVVAKPAEQTPLIAAFAINLLRRAGVPDDVIHLLPGDGRVGAKLVADPRIGGVAFTGSTEVAWKINQSLAAKRGPIAPLIAETGGQNAMIVDSSALPEQVIDDVVFSSFQSAGQRCSALRVLCVQQDIAERVIDMLAGAMAELAIGDPLRLDTDVGPVIDRQAMDMLNVHTERMQRQATLIHRCQLPEKADQGHFFAPCAFEIEQMSDLSGEVFGPILHVLRFSSDALDSLIDTINATGFGLTFGIHSRIDDSIEHVVNRVKAGNAYVNRNIIGAVVGVQPFGGRGLSGTGPKAGGPYYLHRFASERTLSVNTTAAGGNAALMSLQDDDH